jgi:hypothetical protein
VLCGTSRVVPGALRVVAPGTHRGSGSREVHTTLCARDLLRDFERDGIEVFNYPQTNLGAALAPPNHLEDFLAVRHLQANIRVATAQTEERGTGYSRSTRNSYSRSRSERPRQRCRSQGPLDLVAEEGRGENKVVQPVNPTPTLQLTLQPILQLMLWQTLQPTPPTTSTTMHPMLPTFKETLPRTQDTMQELNPP